jgi:hypothetical protein
MIYPFNYIGARIGSICGLLLFVVSTVVLFNCDAWNKNGILYYHIIPDRSIVEKVTNLYFFALGKDF